VTTSSPFELRPFAIPVDEDAVDDLRDRLRRTRWPDQVNDADWGWGTDLTWLRETVEAWAGFDWAARVAELNELDHARATVEDLVLHLVRARVGAEDPATTVPLLLMHGWPGSFAELLPLLPHLDRLGRETGTAYDVVVPSLPGFGFSDVPSTPGTGPGRTAELLHRLMVGLGHERYVVQGGDIGAGLALRLALHHPEAVAGAHVNFPNFGTAHDEADPRTTDDEESEKLRKEWARAEGGYNHEHSTKPQTIGYALTDSPVGLAAWIGEKFHAWTDRSASGGAVPLSSEQVLTGLSVYWFSGSITSAMRMYKESAADPFTLTPQQRIEVPLAVASFPEEIPAQPRSRVEKVANLTRWTDMPRGGHFAALEEPGLLAEDLAAFVATLPDLGPGTA